MNGTILVIDDEESMHDSCSQVLSREGYRILTASDGKRGIWMVRETHPDIVLLDFKLKGRSGPELLRDIARFDPTIVMVVMTGYATVESAVQAMKLGAADFLPKPFTPEELRIIVKRAMDKRALLIETRRLHEENERIRENFVSIITHEMRSPLVGAQQYLDVILEGYTGDLTEKQYSLLAKCRHRIKWILSLVNEWLDMSRMQEAVITERLEQVDMKRVIEEAAELLRIQAEKKHISMVFAIPADAPPIIGNHQALVHLFMNLFSNAIKYNRENGMITTTLECEGDVLAVSVADTGIGIPEENQPFIFDEFFRVRSIHEKIQRLATDTGTGLGLAIAKKIVDAHHGSITVRSTEGTGTTFTVFLPVRRSDDREQV